MDPFEALAAAIAGLFAFLIELANANRQERERLRAAVGALHRAVGETQFYLAKLRDGAPRNDFTQHRLFTMWADAADAFMGISPALVDRLHLKADYWTNPDAWSSERVRVQGIAIDDIAEHLKQLRHDTR